MSEYLYDVNNVRYHLASSRESDSGFDWLFIPGGPGADSRYFIELVNLLDLPGNCWLIDFPGNGDHPVPHNYDFQRWFDLLIPTVKRFNNVIIVGHSFGGVLALLFPELESLIRAVVILNSAPSLWLEASECACKKRNIPEIPERTFFKQDSSQENLEQVFKAMIPYYFSSENLEKGYAFFKDLPFPYTTMLAVMKILTEDKYDAKWIPQRIKAMIIGGELDIICPFSLFLEDQRFNRSNIIKEIVPGAGHWCWLEKPDIVKNHFDNFLKKL